MSALFLSFALLNPYKERVCIDVLGLRLLFVEEYRAIELQLLDVLLALRVDSLEHRLLVVCQTIRRHRHQLRRQPMVVLDDPVEEVTVDGESVRVKRAGHAPIKRKLVDELAGDL